ncbi:GNAT family N-acetyltransferase [Actinacidiphila yeochonensis]|uniref:GNAT family N-acetyltransferase n=1 Tax=Actinacidiphila yeochonensis TaxID=89050 RepID=UPI000689646C|nr:GNAT family N-acetyltransferase [Actinacidiphila yeochonensis]
MTRGEEPTGVVVADVPAAHRYEARSDGGLAGFASYLRTPELDVFVHTEVEDAYAGRGVGSALARTALDEARASGRLVLAVCPFIDAWITRHPEYEDLRYEPASRVAD